MSRRFTAILLVAGVLVSSAACTHSSDAPPAHSPASSSSSAGADPGEANAAASAYRAQLAAWAGTLSHQLAALQFAKNVNLYTVDTARQEAGERAACAGSAAALRLLPSAPRLAASAGTGTASYVSAVATQRAVASGVATLNSDLTQYHAFCQLYVGLLDTTRQDGKLYTQWQKKYEYKGSYTWHGTTYTCSDAAGCLIPDQSTNDASATLYRRTRQFDYTAQGPSPFPGAAWAKLWAAFQAEVATWRAADDRYIAALRYYQGKPTAYRGSKGNKIDAALRYRTKQVPAAAARTTAAVKQSRLFPTAYLAGFARAAKHGAGAEVYFATYQMRQLESQMRQLASTIGKQ